MTLVPVDHSATGKFEREYPDLASVPKPARKWLTFKALWIAIVALTLGVLYVGKRVYMIDSHQESIAALIVARDQLLRANADQENELTDLRRQVGDLTKQLEGPNGLWAWRAGIEHEAEVPTHEKRRR